MTIKFPAQENQFPDFDIWGGPSDEELIARGSMPAPVEQDTAGLCELMEKEAGEYPDWYYDGEGQTVCPVQTSFSWWKPAREEDISNRSWDEACGAYIDD